MRELSHQVVGRDWGVRRGNFFQVLKTTQNLRTLLNQKNLKTLPQLWYSSHKYTMASECEVVDAGCLSGMGNTKFHSSFSGSEKRKNNQRTKTDITFLSHRSLWGVQLCVKAQKPVNQTDLTTEAQVVTQSCPPKEETA